MTKKPHEHGVVVLSDTGRAFHYAANPDDARARYRDVIARVASGATVQRIEHGQVVEEAVVSGTGS